MFEDTLYFLSKKINIMVILMNFKTTIFSVLAIFCLVCSVCAVSAEDGNGTDIDDNSTLIDENDTEIDETGMDDIFDGTEYEYNETVGAAMEPIAGVDASVNETANASGENANTTAAQNMPVSGNPILALFAVTAVLGGCTMLRRRK